MESVITLDVQDARDQIVRDLQESANKIRQALGQLLPSCQENIPKVASPEQMSELLSGLMRAGQWLRVLSTKRDRDLEEEVCNYRAEVERLRSVLPAIQASLLAQRARLEQDRERLNGAAAWAQASSQILK